MSKTNRPYRLAYFVSHPIQYQAPLLKLLSAQADISLTVYFLCDISTREFKDAGFNNTIKWDVPLLEGYHHEFLDSTFVAGDFNFNNPKVRLSSVKKAALADKWDAIWIHGYANIALLYLVFLCQRHRIPLMMRGESNLVSTRMGVIKTLFMRTLLKRCDALLAIGSDNKVFYRHYGVPSEKIFMVPYAVDNHFFQRRPAPLPMQGSPSENDKTVILFASKFIARKHPLTLLQAYNDLDHSFKTRSELWFIGDGEQRPLMEDFIAQNQLERFVTLLGFKNQSELPSYFSRCKLFVLVSEKEPFGLVINEAMNQATPIITSDEVGAASDLVHNGDNGWVIRAGCKTQLTEALREALSDREKLNAMGQRSLELISDWSFEKNVVGIRAALSFLR